MYNTIAVTFHYIRSFWLLKQKWFSWESNTIDGLHSSRTCTSFVSSSSYQTITYTMAKEEEVDDAIPNIDVDFSTDESTGHLRELRKQNELLTQKRTQLTEDMGCRFGNENNKKHTHTLIFNAACL